MAGFPDVRWSLSVPDVVARWAAESEFRTILVIPEAHADADSDALITTWGFHREVPQPVISVAHAVFPAYREMMRSTPHNHAVAVSQAARSVFEDHEPVTTIYNGVDHARLAPSTSREATRARLSIPEGATVIGYVGRWGYQKNPLAAALAASTLRGGVALYVSPHPGEDWLKQARELAELRLVTPDQGLAIGDLYRAMDVCIVPSRSEGFSYAVAEAWFCETPVIATSVGIATENPRHIIPIPQEPDRAALEAVVASALCDTPPYRVGDARSMAMSAYSVERMIADWRVFLEAKLPGAIG